MLEKFKGSPIHKAGLSVARTALGCSEVERLKIVKAVLVLGSIYLEDNSPEDRAKAAYCQEELKLEIIPLAEIRQGFWGRLQDAIARKHNRWCG